MRLAPYGRTIEPPPWLIFSKKFQDFKIGWLLVAIVAGGASVYPTSALAGFFSSLVASAADIGTSTPASGGNSQTMAILVAPEEVAAPKPAREIAIVEGTALLAEAPADGDIVEAVRPKNETISIYEVHEGDTLSQIADMFEVTPNTIRWANDLTGPISAGQRLVILPITGISHTVKKGETLASVAKKYGADVEEIERYNGIDGGGLAVGQVVIVPDGEISAPAQPKKKQPVRSGASTGSALASSATANGISFVRPANGLKTQGIHGHNGIDIGAPIGSSIFAAAAGTVIIAKADGWNGGYGGYVVIEHGGGVQTLYAHCSAVSVSAGQTVAQGDVIGAVGNTGKSTGPHLHFEVRGATNPF